MPNTTPIKEEARRLVEEGIADLDAGITWTSDEIRNKRGIPK